MLDRSEDRRLRERWLFPAWSLLHFGRSEMTMAAPS